ncbi:hypothetical protein AAFF_G00001800 [Aldrovandia affinis]|uniref:Uncharacterized protein n=1 Tax=Aldrovandia affinis TaxID=143900 RepID=A0AAD7TD18_9TELE|nr:hypothetical protein AAFF_G00001800 [Aldrovandia affinis]
MSNQSCPVRRRQLITVETKSAIPGTGEGKNDSSRSIKPKTNVGGTLIFQPLSAVPLTVRTGTPVGTLDWDVQAAAACPFSACDLKA